jgi:hypothetical protein
VNLGTFVDVSGFGRVEWVVFGLHAVVGALFLAAAAQTVTTGGPLQGAGLQALIGLLLIGLGLVVAGTVADRAES